MADLVLVRPFPRTIAMRIAESHKASRLHRVYSVLFWLLITVPIPLIALSIWVQPRLIKTQLAVSEYARTHNIPVEISLRSWRETQDIIDGWTTVALVSLAAFVFALLLPLLYRLLLYILHGRVAFRRRPTDPRPQDPPPESEHRARPDQTEAKPDPFTVLGVARNATFDEIKSAYRTKMREYHPDKVASLGAELRELAERKAKQINEAFEALSRQHATA